MSIIGFLTVSTSAELKINIRALADDISQKASDLIGNISNLPDSNEKQEFLVSSQALQQEIKKQQNSVSSPSLVNLYLIEPQLENLVQEVENFKGIPLHKNEFKSFVPTSIKRKLALKLCGRVKFCSVKIFCFFSTNLRIY